MIEVKSKKVYEGVSKIELLFSLKEVEFPDDGKNQVRLSFDETTYLFVERALKNGQVVVLQLQLKKVSE